MQPDGRNLFGRGALASPLNPRDKEAYTAEIRSEWGLITHADLTTICLTLKQKWRVHWGGLIFAQRCHFVQGWPLKSVPLSYCPSIPGVFHTSLRNYINLSGHNFQRRSGSELLARLGISDTDGSTLSWYMVYITGSFGLILLPFVRVSVVTRCLLILQLRSLQPWETVFICWRIDGCVLKIAVTPRYLHHMRGSGTAFGPWCSGMEEMVFWCVGSSWWLDGKSTLIRGWYLSLPLTIRI